GFDPARIFSMSASASFSMLNRLCISKSRSTGDGGDHGADHGQTLLSLVASQVQRREETNDTGAGGNRQQACRMQKGGEANGGRLAFTAKNRDVRRQFEANHEPETPH